MKFIYQMQHYYRIQSFSSSLNSILMLALVVVVFLGKLTNGQGQGCQFNSQQLSYYDCLIQYNKCTNSTVRNGFNFITCTYNQCLDIDSEDICVKYQKMNLTQSECIRTCCKSSSYGKFTTQMFNKCVEDNDSLVNQSTIRVIVIVIPIVCGPFLVFLIILAACKWNKLKQLFNYYCCNHQTVPPVYQNQHNQQAQIQENRNYFVVSLSSQTGILRNQQSAGNINPPRRHLNLTWTQFQHEIIQHEICSICICGNVDCSTSCGHKFHLECFKLWIGRNPSCPNCNNNSFNDLRLYCLKCKQKQTKLKVEANTKIQHPQVNLVCDSCYRLSSNQC